MSWTSAGDVKERVLQLWGSGRILTAIFTGEPIFPLEVRLKHPAPRDLVERFGDVMDWVKGLKEDERGLHGYGYELHWEPMRNRVQGANDIPVAAVFTTANDALRFIGRYKEAQRWHALAEMIMARQPALAKWIVRRPLVMLDYEADWERLLTILHWFQSHPRPGIYLRQLDIPGVDTKYIEGRRGLLSELLDTVLPHEAIDMSATGASNFTRRYGLRVEAPSVRSRFLDPALYIQGLSDITIPPEQFGTLRLNDCRVFITENRTNGLAFPDFPRSIVVFGLGYGIDRLIEVPWLQKAEIWYWGDIDTHGFGILNRLRGVLPMARSFLMDQKTLMAHRSLWVQEPAEKRYNGEPTLLTPEERTLFDDLRHDRLGPRVRLEQERVGYMWLLQALRAISPE